MTIWSKYTRDGRKVTAARHATGWRVTLAGEVIHEAARLREVYPESVTDIHYGLGVSSGKQSIGLTDAEYAEVKAIEDAVIEEQLEAHRATPRGHYDNLLSQLYKAEATLRRLVDHDENGEPAQEMHLRQRIQNLENDIDEFAAEHPGVMEDIRAEERQRQRMLGRYADDQAANNIQRLMEQ